MNETCKSCGTVFDLDERVLSNKVHWLKCSVCDEKWRVSNTNNQINTDEYPETISLTNHHENEISKVKNELASIKLVVENKSKQMSNLNNPILELKNKSVAEITAELAASKLKSNELNVTKPLKQNKNVNQTDKTKIKKANFMPLVLILLLLVTSVSVFFRSPILGYSLAYLPTFTKKNEEKIHIFFNTIKLPIFVELNHIKIMDFGATFYKNDIKFFGAITNDSFRPIIAPKIKVLAVTEDGKILIEKIIIMDEKVIMPSSKVEFYDIVKANFKKENISIRASILKEALKY